MAELKKLIRGTSTAGDIFDSVNGLADPWRSSDPSSVKIDGFQNDPSEVYSGTDNILQVNKLAMPKYFSKNGAEKPRLILAGIDSLTAGSGLSSYVHELRKYCKAHFGDGGPGYFTFDTDVSNNEGSGGANIVNNWANVGMTLLKNTPINSAPRIYSLDGGGVTIDDGDGTQWFNWSPKEVWHAAKIFYLKKPNGGTFSYWLNAVGRSTRVAVDTNNTELDLGVLEVETDAWKGNALTFDQITGDVTVFGGLFYKDNDECMVSASAFGGFRLDTFTQLDSTFQEKWFAALNPSVYLFNGGTNDSTSSLPDTFKSNMSAFLGQIKTAAPSVDIYVINPNDKSNSNSGGQYFNDYIDKRIEVCQEYGYGYIDLRKNIGNYNRAEELGLMLDETHPNSAGNKVIASIVADELGIPSSVDYSPDTYQFYALKTNLTMKGELDTKRMVTLAGGSSANLYKLGLNNGYSTAMITLNILTLSAEDSKLIEYKAKIKISNQTIEGNATSATVLSVTEVSSDTSSTHSLSVSVSIISEKAVISVTAAGNQNILAFGRYNYAYNVRRQQGVYQHP